MIEVKSIYRRRFPAASRKSRILLWQTLCVAVFQKYIRPEDTVMDIGAGYCEFINAIDCKKKYAVDINPDTKKFAARGVTVLSVRADRIPPAYNRSVNVVFMSNFLEHLAKKENVLTVLTRVKRLLTPRGKLIVLTPNIDLVRQRYWDFFDHHVILNTESLREVFEVCGYHIDRYSVRFLPYTTKNSKLPLTPALIKLYLLVPEFLRPWAGQSLIVASVKRP